VRAGIKASGNPDLGLIVADETLVWAMTGTSNRLRAPCVARNEQLVREQTPIRALATNAGNANAGNGAGGVIANERFAALTAEALGLAPALVLTASTGVIGQPLPVERIEAGLPEAVATLGEGIESFSDAILTTDLVSKHAEVELPGGARIVGVAKGSGMIHPNMATMFAFVLTDARITPTALQAAWSAIVERTFNQISVDGDTSTNDMAIVLASGRVDADEGAFTAGLAEVAESLAKAIARDGEGATALITARVRGASSEAQARRASRAIVASSLVKSAVHGRDPNWGRILSAIGQSQVDADFDRATVTLQGTTVYHRRPLPFDSAALSQAMRAADVAIDVDLAVGEAEGVAWGCDLSANYVMINALYTT
jgi:glutamate N-acetyltransferase/amino-acid N-acetyltransferase